MAETRLLDRDRLDRGFDASATTSPAGSILATIDAARALLAAPLGAQLLDRMVGVVAAARRLLGDEPALDGATVLDPDDFPAGRFDPAKLVILLAGTALSGNDIERELVDAGLPVELADNDTIVAIVSMLDDERTVDALCAHLASIASRLTRTMVHTTTTTQTSSSPVWQSSFPPTVMRPRTAFFAAHERVSATTAIGRVSAEVIAPYPPGTPMLVPGELITSEVVQALQAVAATGARIAYAIDPSLRSFQVVPAH